MAENFDKAILGNVGDIYKKINSKPEIILYTPLFKFVGVINNYFDSQCSMRFNDKSEFSFTIPAQYIDDDGNKVEHEIYHQIERTMLLNISDMGWWYIDNVSYSNDGVESTLSVMAYSYEHTLTLRSVNLYSTNQSDENTMVLNLYGIMTEFKKQTGWGLPQAYYDTGYIYTFYNRQFAIELNTSWYDFLKNAVQEAFDCFVFFDYKNLEIDIKLSYSQVYLRKSNIVLSFDNLIKDISVEESSQRTATALYVKGRDCNIIDVNPLGTSIIYNFTPYLTTKWMSQDTINAVRNWESKIREYEDIYRNLTGFRNFLIDFKQELSTQIQEIDGEIKSDNDKLSLNATYDIWTKNGTNYRTNSSRKARLRETLECVQYAISVLTSNESDCYSILSNLSSFSLAILALGKVTYTQEKYTYVYNTDSNQGSWKTYLYRTVDLYESFSNSGGNINIFKLNNNSFGSAIIDYYVEHMRVPSIGYIVNQLKFENNFTNGQLKELGKYVIDASYHADEYSYDTGDSYTNLINPFNIQIGCVSNSGVSDSSNLPNPDDQWTYGVGYWTTDFIALPSASDNLSIRFFDKNTGDIIKPYAVCLYHETKTMVYYYHYADERQMPDYWNDESARTFGDGTKPKYLRASFKYPYTFAEQENVVPIFSVACTLGSKYKDLNISNIEIEKNLKEQAEKKHEELCLPCRSFTINVANFLKLPDYEIFASDLSLGASVKAETSANHYEDVRLLELTFSFDDVDSFSMVFGNKFGVNNDRIMFRQLVTSSGNTFDIQDSFMSFAYDNNTLM